MSNPWLRLYAEFAHDPKVQMMSEAMQRRYIMLMCMRCSNDLVTLHDEEVAFHLRISSEQWQETKSIFIAKGFIDSDLNLLNWEKRQFKSDSTTSSRERVARHRANKKKSQGNAATNGVTLPVTPDNAADTDTDTDTEQKSNTPSSLRSEGEGADAPPPPPAPAKPSKSKREDCTLATFLANCRSQGVKPVPEDHAIRRWAVDAGISDEMLQIAWVAFRERYIDDTQYRGKRYRDWAGHFANSVKDSWFGLWYRAEEGGEVQWTSKGLLRKQALDARHAAQHAEEGGHAPA